MKVIDLNIATEDSSASPKGLSVVSRQPKRLNNNAGFTLVEIIMVMAIIAVLALMVMPTFSHFVNKVRNTRAIAEIRGVEKDIWARFIDMDRLPNSLAEVGLDGMKDPWGNDYIYLRIGNPGVPRQKPLGIEDLNTDFDLFSRGQDGVYQTIIDDPQSKDDIVRASDGSWIGVGEDF